MNKQSLKEEFLRWFKREGSKDYPNYIPEIVDWFEGKFSERLQGIRERVEGRKVDIATYARNLPKMAKSNYRANVRERTIKNQAIDDILQILDEEIEK